MHGDRKALSIFVPMLSCANVNSLVVLPMPVDVRVTEVNISDTKLMFLLAVSIQEV